MQVYTVVQKLKQAINNSKDVYDQARSFQALEVALATEIAALTDGDLAPYGMTKAQFVAGAAGMAAVVTAYEANDTAILDIYG